jgi:hypothetical protein
LIGKQSVSRPTALGTLISSGAYGSPLTQAYGTPRLPPQPIWAGNIRPGHSGKKGKKKGVTTYVENVDMFLCTNPAQAVLQMWANQKDEYNLEFACYSINISGGGSIGVWDDTITIPDPHFYAVIAVTMQVALGFNLTFNDYGSQGPVHYYTDLGHQGTNTYEFPLWNAAQHGPDLRDPNSARFPYFKWKMTDGATIYTPAWAAGKSLVMPTPIGNVAPFGGSWYNIYYARTVSRMKHLSPMAYNRMFYEEQLGDGDEYSDAGLSSQQRIYPPYAGIESSDLDLGATGAIPNWRLEIAASYGFIPSVMRGPDFTNGDVNVTGTRADAEFADMIEDIVKSGMKQYGAALGYIQSGCNCNELPGLVQKNFMQFGAPSNPHPKFFQPNTAGSILLACMRGNPGFATATISDTPAANTWLPVYVSGDASKPIGIWYVNGCNATTVPNEVDMAAGGSFDSDGFIMEFDPGSTQVDGVPVVVNGNGPTLQASIQTTGEPSYIVAIAISSSGISTNPGPQWENLFPTASQTWEQIYGRKVNAPGIYTFKATVAGGTNAALVLFAVKSAQPAGTVPYAKTLPNIIDYDSLFLTRLACRAGGLQGSLSMDSQRNGTDWISDICMAANCDPVWDGFKFLFIPRSEVSQIGDGSQANNNNGSLNSFGGLASVYLSPTSSGPVHDILESDIVADDKNPPIKIERKAQTARNNIIRIQHFDRNNQYNQAFTSEPESASAALRGPRPGGSTTQETDSIVLNMLVDPQVARKIAAIEGRRRVYLPDVYKLTVHQNLFFLRATNVVTLNESKLGLSKFPVKITSIQENDQRQLAIEAEAFYYGLHSPQVLDSTVIQGYRPDLVGVPGPINTPIIFEPPLRMSASGKPELWFVVSDSDQNYGGSAIYISTDGGASYPLTIGTVNGNATTGYTDTADWPAAADPDAVNPLSVDLTESHGVLPNYTADEENAFLFPNYVSGPLAPTPNFTSFNGATAPFGASSGVNLVPGAGGVGFQACRSQTGPNMGVWFLPTNANCGGMRQEGCCGDSSFVPYKVRPCAACPMHPNNCDAGSPCTADSCLGGSFVPLHPDTGGPFGFQFEAVTCSFDEGVLTDFIYSDGTNPLTLDEVTFPACGSGAGVFIGKLGPTTPGNPSMYVAFCTAPFMSTPAGWTLRGTQSLFTVFTQVGTHGEPPNANYELMTYRTATLTAPNKYTMPASAPAPLRRAVFGLPAPGEGEDHPIGARFAWLNAWQNNPSPPGIFKIPIDPVWLNKALLFKFVQFNQFLSGFADIATVAAYAYTPTGVLSGGGTIGGGTGQPGQPGQTTYSITGGTLTNPTPTQIDMAAATATFSTGSSVSYAPRVFTIPTPLVPTTYYVTIFDPNEVGDGGATPVLPAQARSTQNLVGVPGYVYIGSILVLPAGGGVVTSPGGYPIAAEIQFNGI